MILTNRYPITRKYLMIRNQALNFPIDLFNRKFKKDDVFGVVIDIPMPKNILTTMVCFINGAANLYFNNGDEYTGASQKYKSLVQAAHNLVTKSNLLVKKSKRTTRFDLPIDNAHNIFLLTKRGVYKNFFSAGIISETEIEKRTVYVYYQRILNELRICQLKDISDKQKAEK